MFVNQITILSNVVNYTQEKQKGNTESTNAVSEMRTAKYTVF